MIRLTLAVLGVFGLAWLSACGAGPEKQGAAAGVDGATVSLAANTCWTPATLGSDPQAILELSKTFAVDYFATAYAVDNRPAFQLTEACDAPHHVEVYRVVPIDQVVPKVTDYARFLEFGKSRYAKLDAAVQRACMNKQLAAVARKARVADALVEPAFPGGVDLGWAPPSPAQWSQGQRVYACILTSAQPVQYRYAAVFTKQFPTALRTCISNSPLTFVDCARNHHRERLLTIDVRAAVAAKKFPGPKAISVGSRGRFVEVSASQLAALDRACTSYLRSMSSTSKLTGLAVIDAERWPAPDGSYPVDCEADAPATQNSITTQGSVFDR